MRARLSSHRFIGRTAELAELQLAARDGACARPTLVLLGGDSGVGKTRLVAELEARLGAERGPSAGEPEPELEFQPGEGGAPAQDPPPLILRGDAVQASDGELPYAALLAALRPLVREGHPALGALDGVTRAQLATLLPGLGDAPPPPPAGEATGRVRLFEALLALLAHLAERTPVVLVLEDVHWADRSTLAFMPFLVRSLRAERLTVLLTYRTDELHRRHPLRPLLAELERSERARRLELQPLDREELAEALADILGAPPQPALLDRLFARTEGNPLYTEELLAAGLDGRGALPRSLSDAFLGRIERLTADAQQVARVLALGRPLDEPTLIALTGLADGPLRSALREALAAQVLVTAGDGTFGFRHALLRETLYDDLLPGERAALHTALARHLEAEEILGADDEERLARVLSIAFHHLAAGDQPAALRASVVAADAARRGQAYEEAADLYERALGLWPRVAEPERLVEIDHVALLCRTAGALAILDTRPRADALLREALSELDPEIDPARYATVLGQHSRILFTLNRGAEAVAAAERAIALVPADDPRRDRAWLSGRLARMQALRGRFREAEAGAEAALVDARALGDELAETELLNTLGMVKVSLGDTEAGLASLREAIALGRRRDDPDSVATAHANLADTLLQAGRAHEGLRVAREGLQETPREHVRSRDWITLVMSEMAFAVGDWETAERCLSPAPERMSGILLIFRELREAELAAGVGDHERAGRSLDMICDLVAASSEPQWIAAYGAIAAEVRARGADLEGAQAAVADALDRLEVCTDDIARVAWVSQAGLTVEADRAQRARDLGEAATRRDALARARIHFDRIEAAAVDGGPNERARLVHAKAELARARGRASAAAWHRAAEAWSQLDRPYPAAIARWREAEDLAARGDRDGASAAARDAAAIADDLGSRWLAHELHGLAERARLALDAPAQADVSVAGDGPTPAVPDDPFGLTDRERQVLSLLAEGATNRQIGAALYMAEKTASVHVSRILAKLDVQGRTEAAAVAHRLRLAAPPGTLSRGQSRSAAR